MPRSCSICTHAARAEIEAALARGDAFRNIAARFGSSPAAVFRHKQAHLSMASTTDQDASASEGDSPSSVADHMQAIDRDMPVRSANDAAARAAAQARQAYQMAFQAYEEARKQDWKRSPLAPGIILYPLWNLVEKAKRRCLALGFDPTREG